MKKYELVKDDTKQINGKTLYRIRALRDFGAVKTGDLGGYVESENNLSHVGNCWVGDDAMVYAKAWVCDDAEVCDTALVHDNAWVFGRARVYGNVWVVGNTWVGGNDVIGGDDTIRGYAGNK